MATFDDFNISTLYNDDKCSKPIIDNCSVPIQILGYETCTGDQRVLYDDFEFDRTIATDFGLICDQQYKVCSF